MRSYWSAFRLVAWAMGCMGMWWGIVQAYDRAAACLAFGCFWLLAARDLERIDYNKRTGA
jgi:hypothetical protein